MRKHFMLAWLGVFLIAGCAIKFGSGETEPPATLYIFNLNPPDTQIVVYEEVLKKPSEDLLKSFVGGSRYKLREIMTVNGGQYASVPLRPRLNELQFATSAVSPEIQADFYSDRPSSLEGLSVTANSSETYYATVRARAASEYGPTGGEVLGNLITGPFLEGALFGATGIPITSRSRWHGLGDLLIEQVPPDKGRQLLTQLKPQNSPEPQQKVANRQVFSCRRVAQVSLRIEARSSPRSSTRLSLA